MIIVSIIFCLPCAVPKVGLERTLYYVNEDVGEVEVCAKINSFSDCPIPFTFNVILLTRDDTAGM